MKYSELKSYLELARWGNESDDDYIKVYRNGYTVAVVGLWEQYNIRILDPTQMTEGLYRRLSDFAKTPLEEREEEWRNVIKTIFTESEIAEMDITGFEKIEVTP